MTHHQGNVIEIASKIHRLLDQIDENSKHQRQCVCNAIAFFDIDGTLICDVSGKPIRPIVEVFERCKKMHILIAIVTARIQEHSKLTERMLFDFGIHGYDYIFFKQNAQIDQIAYKRNVRQTVATRHTPIFSVGDQLCDVGEYTGEGFLLLRRN